MLYRVDYKSIAKCHGIVIDFYMKKKFEDALIYQEAFFLANEGSDEVDEAKVLIKSENLEYL